jgi:hypothetical protein
LYFPLTPQQPPVTMPSLYTPPVFFRCGEHGTNLTYQESSLPDREPSCPERSACIACLKPHFDKARPNTSAYRRSRYLRQVDQLINMEAYPREASAIQSSPVHNSGQQQLPSLGIFQRPLDHDERPQHCLAH